MTRAILIALHTGSNTGYAIAPLERAFFRMAQSLVLDDSQIHFGYRHLDRGHPDTLPEGFRNVAALDLRSRAPEAIRAICKYVSRNNIDTVFAFDAPVSLPPFRAIRQAGVRHLISYQGAPMSSLNRGLRLLAKRLEVRFHPSRPDHFIFESEAMRETAVRGRGLPRTDTSVVYLGVDLSRFRRIANHYAHQTFGIPADRKIVVYSGHMEPRKGVDVLIRAFVELVEIRGRRDLHLVLLGNQPGQAESFSPLFSATEAASHITFAGYRSDIAEIFGSADVGAIASTGWDSFTMSSVEMAAAELPLVVSNLQGLAETVEPRITGLTFTPGRHTELADAIEKLGSDPQLRIRMGHAARRRVIQRHSVDQQVAALADVVRKVVSR